MAGKRKYTNLPYKEYTVAYGHFDTNRVYPINKIVLHSSASTKQGLIDTFGGGTRMVSAHYGIDNGGEIMAFLEEYNVAYHAGNYKVNQSSIGIEHVDEGPTVKKHTNAQYDSSIKLVADLCKFYEIPCDLNHIVPHSSIVSTACPNGLDVSRIIDGANILLSPPVIAPVTPPSPPEPPPVVIPPVDTPPYEPPISEDPPASNPSVPDVVVPPAKPSLFAQLIEFLRKLFKLG